MKNTMDTPIVDRIVKAENPSGCIFLLSSPDRVKLVSELRLLLADYERLVKERAAAIRMARDLCDGGEFPDTLWLADVLEKHVFRSGQADGRASVQSTPHMPEPPNHKGVTYRDGKWWIDGVSFLYVYELLHSVARWEDQKNLGDDDYVELMALKEQAERQPTLENVVFGWWTKPNPS